MLRWILTATCTLLMTAPLQEKPAAKPADTQPTTQPATGNTRRPEQAEILRRLINNQQQRAPVQPVDPGGAAIVSSKIPPREDAEGNPLLMDGTMLVDRPGRLVYENGQPRVVLYPDGNSRRPRTMQVLKNQLLEAMEREVKSGFAEFVLSAEVTTYQGANYLLIRRLVRRVDNGNLSPR